MIQPADQSQPSATGAAARVLAVANQKGGVGKSTTVVNLGAWLALRGSRVLLVDLDPQANATTGVGVDARTVSGNIYRMLVEDLPAEDAIEPTSVKNLYVIPSTIDLAGAEIELVAAFSREHKLRRALEPLLADFDFILIDCPPSLGLLTINALTAAREVLVPIQCEFYALEGLGQLLKNVNLVQSSLNPDLRLSGIVLTMFDARTKLAEQVSAQVRSHFPGRVHAAVIPRSVRLSEAPSFGQPVALYDPKSQGSLAYERLAQEVEGVVKDPSGSAESQRESAGDPATQSASTGVAETVDSEEIQPGADGGLATIPSDSVAEEADGRIEIEAIRETPGVEEETAETGDLNSRTMEISGSNSSPERGSEADSAPRTGEPDRSGTTTGEGESAAEEHRAPGGFGAPGIRPQGGTQ